MLLYASEYERTFGGSKEEQKKAVGAFNVPTLENIRAIIEAAEELDCPVILAHAQVHEKLISLPDIIPIMLHYAKKSESTRSCSFRPRFFF